MKEDLQTISDNQSLQCLVKAVQELSLSRNLETVMRIVRTAARQISHADGATFVLRDNGKCYYADEDAISPLWKGQRFPMSACISGWSMLNKQPAVIEDIYADSRIPVDAYRPTFVKSLVMVPIRSMEPIGAIGTYWSWRRMPSEEEVNLLQSLADSTAVAMENIQVYNELENRVKERTRELLESLTREKEMSALKTHFVSIASHELKTPLSTILSSASILEASLGNEAEGRHTKHIKRIESSVNHLNGLLNDFLSMDKLEQGKTDTHLQQFNLQQFIKEVIEELEGTLRPGQQIHYTHSGPVEIILDPRILRNILLNLLSNASKYSPENQPVDVSSESHSDTITIKVKDYGIGIPQEDQPNIFSNFFRAKNATNIQGTGLGLNIVKRYVELLNGTIHFISRFNEGTTFTLHFKNELP